MGAPVSLLMDNHLSGVKRNLFGFYNRIEWRLADIESKECNTKNNISVKDIKRNTVLEAFLRATESTVGQRRGQSAGVAERRLSVVST